MQCFVRIHTQKIQKKNITAATVVTSLKGCECHDFWGQARRAEVEGLPKSDHHVENEAYGNQSTFLDTKCNSQCTAIPVQKADSTGAPKSGMYQDQSPPVWSWHLRRLHLENNAENVATVMVPVRPAAMTAGSISLKPDELLQIL